MITISHPGTGGTAEVTQEAFDEVWAERGWEVADVDHDEDLPPAVPLEPLPDEADIPAEELAGRQAPPRNASCRRWSRFLGAVGVPHDPTTSRKALLEAWDASGAATGALAATSGAIASAAVSTL